jgi:Flp pilus assembly protein TadG
MRLGRRGATAVEHALILPVFFLLVMLVIETGWQWATAAALDHGTRRAARWVSLGNEAPQGQTRSQFMLNTIATTTGMPLDPARLSVTTVAYPNFAAMANPGAGVAGLGGPDQVVRLTVTYRSSLLSPFMSGMVPAGWLEYRSVVVMQNEPFPSN